jgi:hypothetical protein
MQHNSTIGLAVYAVALQTALRLAGLILPMPNSAPTEKEQENEEKVRYSERILQQGILNYGDMPSDNENLQTTKEGSEIQKNNKILIIKDEDKKDEIIHLLKAFLVKNYQITEDQSENFELALRKKSANQPILITSMEENIVLSRSKRISFEQHEKVIAEHIKENCAFEPELFQTEIVDEGELLLLKAQRAENPFRMFYDSHPRHEEAPINNFMRDVADGVNTYFNIMTLGMKPVIGNLFANNYRKKYYDLKNDEICSRRQIHLNVAEVATSIDVGGLSYTRGGGQKSAIPKELMMNKALPDEATYILRNKNTGSSQELFLKVKNDKPSKGSIDNGKEVRLKK